MSGHVKLGLDESNDSSNQRFLGRQKRSADTNTGRAYESNEDSVEEYGVTSVPLSTAAEPKQADMNMKYEPIKED